MKPKFFAATAFAAILAIAAPALAQSESDPSGANRGLLSLDFPGGTLADYGAAIQKAAGWANIVMDPQASEVRIPKCELRSVSVLSALQAASEMVEQIDAQVGIVVNVIHQSGGSPINTVDVQRARSAPPEVVEAKTDRYTVISIREIVAPPSGAAGMKPEAILTAIDTAVGLMGGGPQAVIKYHSDTGLVLMQGTLNQVNVVEQVVERIRADVRGRQGRALGAGDSGRAAASLDDRIAELEKELGRLKQEKAEKSGGAK